MHYAGCTTVLQVKPQKRIEFAGHSILMVPACTISVNEMLRFISGITLNGPILGRPILCKIFRIGMAYRFGVISQFVIGVIIELPEIPAPE